MANGTPGMASSGLLLGESLNLQEKVESEHANSKSKNVGTLKPKCEIQNSKVRIKNLKPQTQSGSLKLQTQNLKSEKKKL